MSGSGTFKCRFCQGVRPHNGQVCLGCGGRLENATDHSKDHGTRTCCPKCNNFSVKEIEPQRFLCNKCCAVFEPDDGFALDDRPDVNFDKRERHCKSSREHQQTARRFR